MNTFCFLSSSRAVPTARLTLPHPLHPRPPSGKTCHVFLCQRQASGPRERSPRGGGVKHRAFKQRAKMNSPVLTPGFHQFLKTSLKEKKITKKPTPTPPSLYLAIHYIPRPQGPATICRACGSSTGKGLCSARQLCLGTRFHLPVATFSHSAASEGALQTALDLGRLPCCGSPNRAPQSQMLCCSHSQASTREEVVHSPLTFSWRTQPCLWRARAEIGDAESGESLKEKALTPLTVWETYPAARRLSGGSRIYQEDR